MRLTVEGTSFVHQSMGEQSSQISNYFIVIQGIIDDYSKYATTLF